MWCQSSLISNHPPLLPSRPLGFRLPVLHDVDLNLDADLAPEADNSIGLRFALGRRAVSPLHPVLDPDLPQSRG